jgi:hypothetical protein
MIDKMPRLFTYVITVYVTNDVTACVTDDVTHRHSERVRTKSSLSFRRNCWTEKSERLKVQSQPTNICKETIFLKFLYCTNPESRGQFHLR